MLTYDDCLGLSGLAPQEIAAIAKHEHVPEIVALEMGWCLCASSAGGQAIRRMILEEIGRADARGDTQEAAELQLVLRHFTGTPCEPPLAGPDRPTAATQDTSAASPAEALPADLDHVTRALGLDTSAAPWVRERVDAYLTAMLRHYGIDRASLQARSQPAMYMAEMRCAACTETARCRRFLAGVSAGEAETPAAFCPNAQLFAELQQA
jgi:hypothetical protein